jgi:hypothetical protein
MEYGKRDHQIDSVLERDGDKVCRALQAFRGRYAQGFSFGAVTLPFRFDAETGQ